MKESEVTKFLISFSGHIQHVRFPAGVFDDQLYLEYEVVWGEDWSPISGLCSGTSQMAQSGRDPERVTFNMPVEIVFGSTNIFGCPQIIVTIRAKNSLFGDSLRGYALFLVPPIAGTHELSASLFRPRSATFIGEWIAWLTGHHPELVDPKMLANGKDNYLLKTESYGSVALTITMMSKDLRKLGYDNNPPVWRRQ